MQTREERSEYLRKYRRENRERHNKRKREWSSKNKEKVRKYSQDCYMKHIEKRREYQKKYYEKNRYELCKNMINDFSHNRIAFFYKNHKKEIDEYLLKYPYEEYGDKIIKYYLYRMEIYKSKFVYDDCYDAGMTAYLYSVYICASTAKDYVIPYIKKIVKIYIKCALVVANETKNICKENNFIPIYLDKDNGKKF